MFNINKTVDKIFDDEKDEKFKNIIKKFLNWSVGILVALVIILLCSIFGLEFDWGIVDRDILIAVVPTILGGYFGFVGAVIGVLGAYLVLKKQLNAEEEKSNDKQILEIKMMKCLLEYTLCETNDVMDKIAGEYCSLYGQYLGSELLEFKVEDKNMKLDKLIEDLISYDPKERDIEFFKELYKEPLSPTGYEDDFAYVDWIRITNVDYKNTYLKIHELVSESKDDNLLVYDKDWNRYLVAIKDSNKFEFEDIQNIVKWLCLFKDNSKKDKKNININIQGDKKDINIKKLKPVEDIIEFINTRDEIITLVEDKNRFEEDSFNWDFDNSREHLATNTSYIKEGIEIVTSFSTKKSS